MYAKNLDKSNIIRKRWVYVINGVILLLLLGLIYAWSIFVVPLEVEFGWHRSDTSMAFSICMSMFCIGGLVAGIVSKIKSIRINMILCAICILVGFSLSSQVTTLIGFYIFYSGFVGFGVGLAYNTLLSSVIKWFPERPGFISGLLLMGFGFGGLVLGTVCMAIINCVGWRATFIGLSITLSTLILLGTCFVKLPGEDDITFLTTAYKTKTHTEVDNEMASAQMLRHPSFRWFFLWASLFTAVGLTIIGHASPIIISMGGNLKTSAFLAGLISVFNGLGRIVGGFTFDSCGWKKTMLGVSGSFIVSLLIVIAAFKSYNIPLMTIGFICCGLSYGGIMPINSSVIASFYGQKHYSMNLSLITLNIIPASFLGPYLAGLLQTATGSYNITFFTMLAISIVGLGLNMLIKKP